jgi:hypothetical protein
MAAEVLAYAAEEVQSLPPPEQGVVIGAVIFEVVTSLVPGMQAKHAAKVKTLDKLSDSKFAASGPGGRVMANVVELVGELRTTKMCFIAGTLVMTASGALPIERIEPGIEVWARHEITMEEGWRPVLQTFTTHPEELFTLGIDTDDDGAADEEITGTGEHPFWVEQFAKFLPMRDLRPGMRLSLAEGRGTAIVTGNVSKRGPPGERFTTYNFEVADFHTYFVGNSRVLVHNDGAPCDKILSQFFREARAIGGSSAQRAELRFEMLKSTKLKLGSDAAILDASWAQSARDVGAKMIGDFSPLGGPITDVSKLPTVNNWNNSFFGTASRKVVKVDTEVHHIVPKELIRIMNRKNVFSSNFPGGFPHNNVPGIPLSKADHAALHGQMTPQLLKDSTFKNADADIQADMLVSWYRSNGYGAQADVAEAWFKAQQILP